MEILEIVPPLESQLNTVVRDDTDILLRAVEIAYLGRNLDIPKNARSYFLIEVGTESQSVVKSRKVGSYIV